MAPFTQAQLCIKLAMLRLWQEKTPGQNRGDGMGNTLSESNQISLEQSAWVNHGEIH